ncbi:MAG: Ig-like domain-containing protein [Bacteroidales bacterium]|jgi:hypothetical protein|nr:Ig-like domain-containing protein [Bacteroidales bacterium]
MKHKFIIAVAAFVLCAVAFTNSTKAQQTFPYSENFDALTTPALPTGWVAIDANADGNTFVSSNHQHASGFFGGHNGTQYLSSGDGTINDWVFTDQFYFVAGTPYTNTFWIQKGSSYGIYTLDIYLVSAQNESSIVETLYSMEVPYSPIEVENVFTPVTTGNYYLAIHVTSSQWGYKVCIDDFYIEEGEPLVAMTGYYPTSTTQDIDVITPIYAVFDHVLTATDLSLVTVSGATGVIATIDSNKLLIEHDPLTYNTTYSVNIPNGAIANFAGGTWSFTTVGSDVVLYQMYPVDNVTGVFPNMPVTMLFNQQINIIDPSLITISGGSNIGNITTDIDGKYLIITHDAYQKDMTYTFTIANGAIDRFDSTVSVTFQTTHAGDIPDTTTLYGPINNIVNVRAVSDNGRYVTGSSSIYGGFMWDVLESGHYVMSSTGGEGYRVSNDGHTAFRRYSGNTIDPALPVIWFENETYFLPIPQYGDVQTITADGMRAAGYASSGSMTGAMPVVWDRQPNGNWIATEWATPSGTLQTRIADLSNDGNVGVGRINISGQTMTVYDACYWLSPNSITVQTGWQTETNTEYTCISGNGKYAGLRAGLQHPYIHNLETNTLTQLSNGDIINAITDDGLAAVYSGNPTLGGDAYIYTPETGLKLFTQWITEDIENYYNIDQTGKALMLSIASNPTCRIMDISPDGKNWAMQKDDEAYMMHLVKHNNLANVESTKINVYPNPANDRIMIEGEGFNRIKLYDILGRELINMPVRSSVATIDLTALTNGIYTMKFLLNDKTVNTRKIVKN